jgi:hypothetical protein
VGSFLTIFPRKVPNARLAAKTTVASEIYDIPNEPLTFAGDAFGPRSEDQIIAYTWRKFLDTGNSAWPLRARIFWPCGPVKVQASREQQTCNFSSHASSRRCFPMGSDSNDNEEACYRIAIFLSECC